MSDMVTLVPSSGESIQVTRKVARMNKLIADMLDIIEDDSTVIPLPTLNHALVKKIFVWCDHHQDDIIRPDEKPFRVNNSYRDSEFDAAFVKIPKEALYELLHAADYLNNRRLMDLAAKSIAQLLRGKHPDEIRALFGIEKLEDEAQIMFEHEEFKKGRPLF